MAADAGVRKAKKKRKVVVTAIDAAPSLEDRLAAFGEAFMSSIDGPPPRSNPSRQARAGAPSEQHKETDGLKGALGTLGAPGAPGPPGAPGKPGEGKKRRRNKNKNKNRECNNSIKETSSNAAARGSPVGVAGASVAGSHSGSAPEVRVGSGSGDGKGGPSGRDVHDRPPRMPAKDRRKFMSGKVSDIRSSRKDETSDSQRRSGGRSEEDAEFQKTLREVLDYVTPLLGKRERQQYEDAKIRSLGGSLEKQHMPYKRFQETIKNNKEKRRKLVEEDKLAGVEMSANAYRASWVVDGDIKKKKEALKEKKKRQQDGLMRLGMDARERNGMATIPKMAIKNLQRGGGKR